MKLSLWFEAARPKTLPASVVPVLVGTAAAGRFVPWRLAAALAVAVALQVAVNFANDFFDAAKGVDSEERVGPRRLTSSGLIAPGQMRAAAAACILVAAAAGAALALAVDPRLLVVGAACILAALGYSGGRRPYGASGLGEVFVFVFFGLVATVGSAYVQTKSVPAAAVAASVPVGLLASALLVVNNLRDIETDARAGKRTLAVKLGEGGTRRLFRTLVFAAFVFLPVVGAAGGGAPVLLPILSMPLARPALLGVEDRSGNDLVEPLIQTARLHLIFGLLLATGLVLRRVSAIGVPV